MGSNLERERRRKMYKGSDGTLTTRDAFMRIIAKKRAATVARNNRVGGQSAWEKMYNSSKRIGGPRKGGR